MDSNLSDDDIVSARIVSIDSLGLMTIKFNHELDTVYFNSDV